MCGMKSKTFLNGGCSLFFVLTVFLFIISNHVILANSDELSITAPRKSNSNKRSISKAEKLKRLLSKIDKQIQFQVPEDFKAESWCKPHNLEGPAIISVAIAPYMRFYIESFAGTARKTGYNGDIVLGVSSDRPGFLNGLREFDVIAYSITPECNGKESHDIRCHLKGQTLSLSINMLRFYIYIFWAKQYNSDAVLMISDFRDVIFQSNPFTYNIKDWMPPAAQFVTFQEAFPNKVIYRCKFNSAWIYNCYGEDNFRKVSSNTVACSGVSFGTADAIIVYSFLMVQQLNPEVRYGSQEAAKLPSDSNTQCTDTVGVDQGFHNWLLYSNQLERFMDVKIYQQGEGPVNTIGGLSGGYNTQFFNLTLREMKVLRGRAEDLDLTIHNWNGDISPVLHQHDRFKQELAPLRALKGFKG